MAEMEDCLEGHGLIGGIGIVLFDWMNRYKILSGFFHKIVFAPRSLVCMQYILLTYHR
ncbi:hypothetical protein C8R32_12331 [Nitrosospira sp. Nsp5]|uniref:Uncharacterized protein n=1 Tax=Nitrosospira multiformis TaxID=1231 RepID=A0ABY0TDD4_9PROT|nr:hypothetical protein C8R32_12331 [Nitrosospira sp. Nsp5]SDQ66193.1 hypothetical protein SAMN05216402_1748 [Nitrosospira multiformis]